MQNHVDKQRDMCRSILPSSRRKTARWNAAYVKRHHRRHIRAELRDWRSFDDPDDFEGFVDFDTNRPTNPGGSWEDWGTINRARNARRNMDKVGPLVHWTEQTAKRLPGDDIDKYNYFRAILPKNLIGRHALSHIDHLFDLPNAPAWWRYGRSTYDNSAAEAKFLDFVSRIRETVATGDHAALNRYCRSHGVPVCIGLDNVDAWCIAVVPHLRGLDVRDDVDKVMRKLLSEPRQRYIRY